MIESKLLLATLNSYDTAADCIVAFSRCAWANFCQDRLSGTVPVSLTRAALRSITAILKESGEDLLVPQDILAAIIGGIQANGMAFDQYRFTPAVHQPHVLVDRLLPELQDSKTARYYAVKSIRSFYHFHTSPTHIRILHTLSLKLNELLDEQLATGSSFLKLRLVYERLQAVPEVASQDIEFFLEICRAAGYIRTTYPRDTSKGEISSRTTHVDVEYLQGILLGLPTDIKGFDDLFGGNGIQFSERGLALQGTAEELPGRLVFITGRYGTGKTCLAIQLAVNVAKRGGLAWIVPFEQSAEEYLFILESMGLLRDARQVPVITNAFQARKLVESSRLPNGALVILRSPQSSFSDFLVEFSESAERLRHVRLKVLIADPISTVPVDPSSSVQTIRSMTLNAIDRITKTFTANVVLVGEEGSSLDQSYLQNIADTVIRLSVDEVSGYAQRFFQILKSRFQREQRGKHPFTITPTVGIRIAPTPSAVLSRIRSRTLKEPREHTTIGTLDLDRLLGAQAIYSGDAIVVSGPEGSFRTQLGIGFCSGGEGSHFKLTEQQLRHTNDLQKRLLTDENWLANTFRNLLSRAERRYLQSRATEEELGSTGLSILLSKLDQVLFYAELSSSTGDHVMVDTLHAISSSNRRLARNLDFFETEYADHIKDVFNRPREVSLWVAARDNIATVENLLKGRAERRLRKQIVVLALPQGFVDPGFILQQIEEVFEQTSREGYRIDRVFVDDVAQWDMSCPLVATEKIFGDTLVELIRRYQCTSLYACQDLPSLLEGTSKQGRTVQEQIAHKADCMMRLSKRDVRGVSRVMLRVESTRDMRHRTDEVELSLGVSGVEVKSGAPLLRVSRHGEPEPIAVRLFLHAESAAQAEYNEGVRKWASIVLSEKVSLESPSISPDTFAFSYASALDELQVFQLDEYELPSNLETARQRLHTYEVKDIPLRGQDFREDLLGRCLSGEVLFAVPYLTNLSMMSVRKDGVYKGSSSDLSWRELGEQCINFDILCPSSDDRYYHKLLFDFVKGFDENYNCLFFEILRWLMLEDTITIPKWDRGNLATVLGLPQAYEAAVIFRRVARRAELCSNKGHRWPQVNKEAEVCRHWYTTLNQMLSGMNSEEREQIAVDLLPGDVTTAGEWYVGIPKHSAAPSVGMEIIRLLTSREAEIQRMHLGAGLPVRRSLYAGSENEERRMSAPDHLRVSPYFAFDTTRLSLAYSKAVRRSEFMQYRKIAKSLARALRSILDLGDSRSTGCEDDIRSILDELIFSIEFLKLG